MNFLLGDRKVFEDDILRVSVYDDKNKAFSVGNRQYRGICSLRSGLLVIHEAKLYPCFDSSDYLYENRYYHWFLFCSSLKQAAALRKQIGNHTLPLYQYADPSQRSNWHNHYKNVHAPSVFYEDGFSRLIVVEKK